MKIEMPFEFGDKLYWVNLARSTHSFLRKKRLLG